MIFLKEDREYQINNKNITFKFEKEDNIQKNIDNYKLSAFIEGSYLGHITVSNYSKDFDYKGNFIKSLFGTKNVKKIIIKNKSKIKKDINEHDNKNINFFLECLENLNLKKEKILLSYLKDFYSEKIFQTKYKDYLEETKNSNFVEYVFVDEDFRGQGISEILYEKMAKISLNNNKKLCSSIFQTEHGEKLWNRFLRNKTFPVTKKDNIYYINKDILKKDFQNKKSDTKKLKF
tara:strand:- start:3883 stop:4581 length:699 start_codon:yes stop_codon:yes gene_type:complete